MDDKRSGGIEKLRGYLPPSEPRWLSKLLFEEAGDPAAMGRDEFVVAFLVADIKNGTVPFERGNRARG